MLRCSNSITARIMAMEWGKEGHWRAHKRVGGALPIDAKEQAEARYSAAAFS
jgi:hypothetical protein